jgi:ABC-type uncharacterized transport system involved in gliding motility auxiliary subunit
MSAPFNRRWATGANAILVSLITLVLAAVLAELAGRHPARLDLSEDGWMTLDPDTVAALSLVQQRGEQVTITAFSAQAKDEAAWARDRMLKDFLAALQQQDQVQTRFVDFDLDRLTAERLGVDRYGTVVVQSGADRVDLADRELFRVKGPKNAREVSFIGESALAAALRQVVSQRRGAVIALSGHGERELYDRGLGELRGLASSISDQGLVARTVNLLEEAGSSVPSVPADAAVVLMVGPKQPMASAEIEALRAFLKSGGGIGVFLEGTGAEPAWLAELGLGLEPGVALDPQRQFPNADRPVLGYGSHPIVEGLARDGVSTVVSVAAPVRTEPVAGVTSSILLRTSRQGWVERGQESPPSFDPQLDRAGPVTVAAALTVARPHPWAGERPGRVVLVGDVDLAADELMGEGPGNATFVTNVVRWLGGTDEPLTPVGRPLPFRRLQLGTTQLGVIRAVLLVGVPGLVALLGALTLWGRRQR